MLNKAMRRTALCCLLAGIVNPSSVIWAAKDIWSKGGGLGAAGDMSISVGGVGSCTTGGGTGNTTFQIAGGNCAGILGPSSVAGTGGSFTFNTGGTYLLSQVALSAVLNSFGAPPGTYGVTIVVGKTGGGPCFVAPNPCFEVTCVGVTPTLTCTSTSGTQAVTLI